MRVEVIISVTGSLWRPCMQNWNRCVKPKLKTRHNRHPTPAGPLPSSWPVSHCHHLCVCVFGRGAALKNSFIFLRLFLSAPRKDDFWHLLRLFAADVLRSQRVAPLQALIEAQGGSCEHSAAAQRPTVSHRNTYTYMYDTITGATCGGGSHIAWNRSFCSR